MKNIQINLIKQHFQQGKKGIQILNILKIAFGKEALCKSQVYEHIKKLKKNIKPGRPGKPKYCRSKEKIAEISAHLKNCPELALRDISQLVSISHESVRTILKNDLKLKKKLKSWVPHLLTPAQKRTRYEYAKKKLHWLNKYK